MSFVFYIPSPQTVARGWLFKHLLDDNKHAQHSKEVLDEQAILEGERLHRPGQSTRGISIVRTEKQYEIMLNTLASKADWELAIRAAAVIAESADERVQPEDTKEMPLKDFLLYCSSEWIEQHLTNGIKELLNTIYTTKIPVVLFGYRGRFSIGIDLLNRLNLNGKPERDIYNELVREFIDVQNNLAGYHIPVQLMSDGPVGGKQEDMLIWIPQIATHLYQTQWILVGDNQEPQTQRRLFKIKFEKLRQYISASAHANLVDECNYLIDAYSDQETNDLLKSIQHDVESIIDTPIVSNQSQSIHSKKVWWKFWS